MLLTEEKAKTKWCPHAVASHTNPRSGFDDMSYQKLHICIGTMCMAWRWGDLPPAFVEITDTWWPEDYDLPTCAIDEPDRPDDVPEIAVWIEFSSSAESEDGGYWALPIEVANQKREEARAEQQSKRRGFCGLSGKAGA